VKVEAAYKSDLMHGNGIRNYLFAHTSRALERAPEFQQM
jgi:hypothetical protein